MRRRVPISVGAALSAALLLGALPARALPGDDNTTAPPDRLSLVCSGTMLADGIESTVDARGALDLGAGRITGFGVGSADIVLVTAAAVGFDTSVPATVRLARASLSDAIAPVPEAPATVTRGTFDRRSGALHITVASGRDLRRTLIEMRLACRTSPAPR